MAKESLITEVNDWLNDQALGQPHILDLFEGVCQRLRSIGIPIGRAMLMWSTLHPLFRAEMVLWRRGVGAELNHFNHQDTSSEIWLRSPMHYMLEHGVAVFRRRLIGPEKLLDFAVLEDLAEEGFTDYLVVSTELFPHAMFRDDKRRGMIVTWAADRPNGFTDEELAGLQRIQRQLATTCKTVIQTQISRNISEAYLGRQTGGKVLNGLIRLGEAEETPALVWFSDLRSSTRLAESMPPADFLALLNVYFECAARPVISAGGEVLGFIGDAVLAIFPVTSEAELPAVAGRAMTAVRESLALGDAANAKRVQAGLDPIRYGIGLNIGTVTYGNIGVPERLAFSAIGSTVIEVARIEKMTKTLGSRVLASSDIAALAPDQWRSMGQHRLDGFGQTTELFGFQESAAAQAA